MGLTEGHGVEHARVGRGAHRLVDDADAVLHSALGHVQVQVHHEEGDEQAVDQVLGQAHQDPHPVPRKVTHGAPGHTHTHTHTHSQMLVRLIFAEILYNGVPKIAVVAVVHLSLTPSDHKAAV